MSELGEMLNKGSGRKFTAVNVTKIVKTPGFKAQSYNMGAVPFKPQPFGGPGGLEARELQAKITRLEKELKLVKSELETTKTAAARELDLAKTEAAEEGKRQGREEAELEYKSKYDKSVSDLTKGVQNSLQKLGKEKQRLFIQWEKEVLDIILTCIEKIVSGELSGNKKLWAPIIKNAMQDLGSSHPLTLRVHPDNFNSISDLKNLWLPLNGSLDQIKVEADERLQPFSCNIDAGSTSVEVSLEKILQGLSKSFEELYQNRLLETEERQPASVESEKGNEGPEEKITPETNTENLTSDVENPSAPPSGPSRKNKLLDVDLGAPPPGKPGEEPQKD